MVESEKWKRLRSIIAPTFATGKLRKIKPCIDDICLVLIKNLNNSLLKSNNGILEIKEFAGAFTMDTIIQVAFSTKVDSLIDPNNPIIKNVKKLSNEVSLKNILIFAFIFICPKFTKKFLKRFRLNGDVVDFFTGFAQEIINTKRKKFQEKDFSKANTFIEFLLEAEHEFEIQQQQQQIINQADNLESNEEYRKTSKCKIKLNLVFFFIINFFLISY